MPLIVFSHANSFPAATYTLLFRSLRARGFKVKAIDRFGHDPEYPVTSNWPHLVRQLARGKDDRALQARRVEEITEDLPHLPDFSEFDIAFRPVDECSFGDMRSAFYAGYEESDREHLLIGMAGRRLAEGRTLVSTTFVVPYPPGFPVLVPGQVVSKEIVYFLAQLDVKEIHGYNPELGLSVFTETALARMEAQRGAATAAVGSALPVVTLPADARSNADGAARTVTGES